MKRIKNLVLAITLCLLPVMAKADMGAPMTTAYDVVITNPNGVEIGYGKNKTIIPFDTKVTVNFEHEDDGELYGSVSYNDTYGEINLKDAKIYNTNIDLSTFRKTDKTELYVFKEGAYLYKGPSKAYGKVDGDVMIPVGTTVSYEYFDEMWLYVEYKGTKGWLYYNASSQMYSDVDVAVAYKANDNNRIFLTSNVDEIYSEPKYNSTKEKVNIPAQTEVTYDIYLSSGGARFAHIKYVGKEGWIIASNSIRSDAIYEESCRDGIVMDDVTIYSEFNNLSSASSDKIPKGAKVELIYSYETDNATWNKVLYNNKEVWVGINNERNTNVLPIAYSWTTIGVYKVERDTKVYEEPNISSKVVGNLTKDKEIDSLYIYYNNEGAGGTWQYFDNGSIKGWVNQVDLTYDRSKSKPSCKANFVEDDDNNKDKKDDKKSNENMLLKASLIAGAIAIVIGLTVIVIVILVNKKKKSK